eukprot:324714-Rhodomonas_salina.1
MTRKYRKGLLENPSMVHDAQRVRPVSVSSLVQPRPNASEPSWDCEPQRKQSVSVFAFQPVDQGLLPRWPVT